jgi:hypothetical protein
MNEPVEGVETAKTQLRYIYNSYRTALLNRKYYGERLSVYQKYNTATEILIAVGAAGSGGVAGLAIWGSITGQYAWLLISGVATVLGVIKPVLQFGRHIENYTKLYAGHSNVYLDLKSMVEDIEVSKSLPPKLADKYESIRNRIVELGGLDDPMPNKKLILKLQRQVNEEIPAESLWVP